MKCNPYMGVGTPAEGDRFVGRHELLHQVESDLLAQAQVSLAGLGRMGKTSLGRQVLNKIAREHADIATARIQLNEFRRERDLWEEILAVFFPDITPDLPDNSDDAYRMFRRTLRKRKQAGFRGILLIDEFDSVTKYDNQRVIIDRLRELACDRGTYGMTFLFISRRSLARIQNECAGSNLFGICQKYYLRPFDKKETEELIALSKMDLKEDFLYVLYMYTGGYPYLLESFMKDFYDLHIQTPEKSNEELFLDTYTEVRHVFLDLFEEIRKFLSYDDGKVWQTLCSEFIPPKEREADSEIMQLLLDYGLINENTKSTCLSDSFCDYILAHQHHLSMWEPLSNFEKAVRIIVKAGLVQLYGDRWYDDAPKCKPCYEKPFAELKERASHDQMLFKIGGPGDLLEYSYPGTVKDIIITEWDYFKDFFGGDKSQFRKSMDAIHDARNMLSHSRRTELIPPQVMWSAKKAIDYLNKFLDRPHE